MVTASKGAGLRKTQSGTVSALPVITFGVFNLTPTGLEVRGKGAEFDDWQSAMTTADYMAEKAPFWKADLLEYAHGREDWAELIDQVVDAGTFTRASIAQYRSVAKRVPPEQRVEGLSFSHHEAVASLPVSDRQPILQQAKREHLSVSETRQLARKGRKIRRVLKGQAGELATLHGQLREAAHEAAEACREIPKQDGKHADKAIKRARRYLGECEEVAARLGKAQGKA